VRGREAAGCVAPSDYERVRDEVIGALLDWKLPDGGPVVARALRREEVHPGPCVERAPDVVVELALDAGYGLSLVATPWRETAPEALRTLDDAALGGGRGRGLNGTHRPDGVWIGLGPAATRPPPARLADVAPVLLAAMGVPWRAPSTLPPLAPSAYTPEQEARVAARLRALGYLE
jgi:predicted AlkP superfamily phosphohydrolase/phosphomutase